MFKGTELWDSVPTVIPLFEKIIGSMVNNLQAQNGKNTTGQLLSYVSVARTRIHCLVIQNHHCYTASRMFSTRKILNTDVTFRLALVIPRDTL